MKCETGYELHFCTKRRDKDSTIVSWFRWNLGPDFFKTLNTYGRLPLDMNIKKLMDSMEQRDVLKQREQKAAAEIAQLKKELAE